MVGGFPDGTTPVNDPSKPRLRVVVVVVGALAAVVLLTVSLVVGSGTPQNEQPAPPSTTALEPDPGAATPVRGGFEDIDWPAALTGRLFCSAIDPDVFLQRQDYTGDGLEEAVISYRCAASPSPSPSGEPYSQVEVFDGRSRPDELLSLGLLVQTPSASASPEDAMRLGMLVNEVHLEGPSIRVVGHVYPRGNPYCPTYEGTVSATWNGAGFDVTDRRDYVAFSC